MTIGFERIGSMAAELLVAREEIAHLRKLASVMSDPVFGATHD